MDWDRPVLYLTAIMFIVVLAIVFGILVLNMMNIRIKKIEENQNLEYEENKALRSEIKDVIVLLTKSKY